MLPAPLAFSGRTAWDDRDEVHAAVARFIERRIALWRAMLAFLPGVEPICMLARKVLPRQLSPDGILLHLESTVRALGADDDATRCAAYVAARRAAAAKLGPADPDLLLCDRILSDLSDLECGESAGLGLNISLQPEHLPRFVDYVSRVWLHRRALEAAWNALLAVDEQVFTFARAVRPDSLPFAERIEAGRLGLRLALGRFDPRRGVRFSAHAAWWIRRAIRCAATQHEPADGPTVVPVLAAWQFRHTLREFAALHGRAPLYEELVVLAGLSRAAIRRDGGA